MLIMGIIPRDSQLQQRIEIKEMLMIAAWQVITLRALLCSHLLLLLEDKLLQWQCKFNRRVLDKAEEIR